MNKHIIIINGKGCSGKDTCAEFVEQTYISQVVSVSTIDCIKIIALDCGWTGSKSHKDRKFLSDLKKLVSDYSDLPHRTVMSLVNQFCQNSPYTIMFIHCREPENIQRLVSDISEYDNCVCSTLLITRPSIEDENFGNSSDDDVENYTYNYIFNNSFESLDDYRKSFMEFFNSTILS